MNNIVTVLGQLVQDEIFIKKSKFKKIGGTAFYSSIIYYITGLRPKIYTSTSKSIENKFINLTKKKIKIFNNKNKKATIFKVFYQNKFLDERKIFVNFNNKPINYKIKNSKILHFGPLLYKDISLNVYNLIKKFNGVKIIDVQGLIRNENNGKVVKFENKKIIDIISNFNILKANKEELKIISKILKKNKKNTIKKIFSLGINEILETNGSKGSIIHTKTKKIKLPAFKMKKQKDTTGCGDIYTATYAFFRYQNISILKSGLAASQIAGLRTEMSEILLEKIKTKVTNLLNDFKNK